MEILLGALIGLYVLLRLFKEFTKTMLVIIFVILIVAAAIFEVNCQNNGSC